MENADFSVEIEVNRLQRTESYMRLSETEEDDASEFPSLGESQDDDNGEWEDERGDDGEGTRQGGSGVGLPALEKLVVNYQKPAAVGRPKGTYKPVEGRRANNYRTTRRLNLVMEVMKKAGFRSIGQFLCVLFADNQQANVNKCGRFFLQGGFSKVLSMWFKDPRSYKLSVDHRKEVIDLVGVWLEKELVTLEKTGIQRLPSATFGHKVLENFSFEKLREQYLASCPLLGGLLNHLCKRGREKNRVENAAEKRNEASCESEDDDTLREPKENKQQRPPGKNLSRVSKKYRPPVKNPRKGISRERCLVSILSVVLYGRSWQNNCFQTVLGFYLNAEGAGKECIRTLHGLGLSSSYNHIRLCEISNAKSSLDLVTEKVRERPFMISWDNINRLIKVSRELVHLKNHMVNWTTMSVILLEGDLPATFAVPAGWVNERSREYLTGRHFMLSTEAVEYYPAMFKKSISELILKYFRRQATGERVIGGVRLKWKGYLMKEYHPLALRKSDLHVLKTMPLNEGTLDDTIELFRRIGEQIGLQLEELDKRRILCSGDQLSTKLLRASRFLTNEEDKDMNLDWTLPVIGLFHLRMSILHMILRTFLGNEDGREPGSLNKFKNLLKRTRITEKMTCFKACEDLVNQVYEGHILAALMSELGVSSVDGLGVSLRGCDVGGVVKTLYEKHFGMGMVEHMREENGFHDLPKKRGKRELSEEEKAEIRLCDEKSDIPFENAVLFVQVVGVYRELVNAIHVADTGRIMLSLEYITIMFQASGLMNYAQELLELTTSFRYEWGSELKEMYLNNILVNMSGKVEGWMEIDRFQEHVVRTISERWNPNGNISSGNYLRDVISPNMMIVKDMKERIKISATGKGSSRGHYRAKERGDIVVIAREIREEKVWTFTSSRVQGHGTLYSRCKDLLADGTAKLMRGDVIDRWKHDSSIKRGSFEDGGEEGHGNGSRHVMGDEGEGGDNLGDLEEVEDEGENESWGGGRHHNRIFDLFEEITGGRDDDEDDLEDIDEE